jgi:KamA family protein
MLLPEDYEAMAALIRRGASRQEVNQLAHRIRLGLRPHPGGQMELNVPQIDGKPLPGLQHKYRETVLYFPGHGQTCHAYCSYCFRWAQVVGMPELKFSATEVDDLVTYLKVHEEVSDLLITGGDPMIMKTRLLEKVLEPVLEPSLEHVRNIRIGTKAVAFWPHRFVDDGDADDLLRLFERVVQSGRHLALMGHFSHPVDISTEEAREAIRRIRSTGAEIRMQSPVVRHVNDSSEVWRDLANTGVYLGMVPYYMFMERDTGARNYFEIPILRAHGIYRDAFAGLSGLARTLRGPSMSATPGKVHVVGTCPMGDKEVFTLRYLQARDPSLVGRPFFADLDPEATWFSQLRPADPASAAFFPHC